MTVPANARRRQYLGNGVATVFGGPMAFAASNVKASIFYGGVITDISSSDFTVDRLGYESGTRVVMKNPVPSGALLTLLNVSPYTQETDITNQGAFHAETVEKGYDALELQIQQLADLSDRTIHLPDNYPSPLPNIALPLPEPGKAIGWNYDGSGLRNLDLTGPADLALRSDLADPTGGAALIAYRLPGAGAVGRRLDEALSDDFLPTVEAYGARADGSDDSAALVAMHNALGYIRLQRKTYHCPNGLSVSANRIIIIGSGKPVPNSTLTGLMDGSGSIIVGTITLRASAFYLVDFGADVGDTRGFDSLQEGFVADAPEGGEGTDSYIRGVASMGPTGAVSSHGFLHEGFNRFRISDMDIYHHNYGLVCKSRNGIIRGIRGYGVKTADVYLKSSTPGGAGNVLSGLVDNVIVDDVIGEHFGSDGFAPAFGLWVHAEGVAATRVIGSNISITGGRAAARVHADGGQVVANVQLSNLKATNSAIGWETFGTSFEVTCDNLVVENPSFGHAFETDTLSANWRCTNINLVITLAEIGGTDAALMRGTGSWDGFTARTINPMLITHNASAIRGGRKSGTVSYSGEGPLTPGAGVALVGGEITPAISVKPDNTLCLTGMFNPSAAASDTLATLSGGLSFGPARYFSVAGQLTAGSAYTNCVVIASDTVLRLIAPAYGTLKQVELSGVTVNL